MEKKETFGLEEEYFLKKVIELIKKEGYDNTLKNLKKIKPEFFKRFINPLSKAYISFVLDTKMERALEIGCGYGSLSLELSKIFKKVYAVDINPYNIELLKLRIKQEKIKNIIPIKTDAFSINYPDNFFDAIFLVGVLEWIPLSYKGEPSEIQRKLLIFLRNKLRKKGKIIIGIENRYGAQYFLGWKDHNGLWGTNLIPRIIANFFSKLIKNEEYRTYTYSYWGYNKLLKSCGFKPKILMALRSYRYPRFIIPLEKDKISFFFKNIFIPRNRIEKYLSKLAPYLPLIFYKLFAPHFIIVGEKK